MSNPVHATRTKATRNETDDAIDDATTATDREVRLLGSIYTSGGMISIATPAAIAAIPERLWEEALGANENGELAAIGRGAHIKADSIGWCDVSVVWEGERIVSVILDLYGREGQDDS